MNQTSMSLSIRKVPHRPDLFEFTISTPMLRAQFRLPRTQVNKLRILIERALTSKQSS